MNRRKKTLFLIIGIMTLLLAILIGGLFIKGEWLEADFTRKNLPPSPSYIYGTDWLGRNMVLRTIKGLSISLLVGLSASIVSGGMALIIGSIGGVAPRKIDQLINWFIDLVMGIPHLVLLIMISFALGRGVKGILIGIAITHWTSLARLIRGEVLQLRSEHYIRVSQSLGKSRLYIIKKHILPHILPHILVGTILLFPHAILHEAAISFLGFGLSPEQPAVGIILSESMKYLSSGMWWLAVLPGLSLVFIVVLFEKLGDHLKVLLDPHSSQE